MATMLREISYQPGTNARFMEDIITWGIDPLIELADILEEEADEKGIYDPEDPEKTKRLFFAAYEIVNHLQDLKEALERLMNEVRKKGKSDVFGGKKG